MSKRVDAPYTSGRTKSWVKTKCSKREEFVIGGYTPHIREKDLIGALLLGTVRPGSKEIRFSGKVGSGFGDRERRELYRRCEKLRVDRSPFADGPGPRSNARWTSPVLVAEVSFAERTREGHLRHPSFHGLRLDKTIKDLRESSDRP